MTEISARQTLDQTDPLNLLSVEAAVQHVRSTSLSNLIPASVYFLSNYTISGIDSFLDYHGLKSGLNIEMGFGDYNVIHQPLMRTDSELHAFDPNIIVISLMYDVIARSGDVDVCSELRELFELAARSTSATIAVNTFISPPARDTTSPEGVSKSARILAANTFIRQFVKNNRSKFCLCDWDQYIQAYGYNEAIDRRYWYMAKAPFKPAFLSSYAADISKIARAITGLGKKCLILDCDGTLWGGVLGEEGINGIHLHPNDYPGNVFFEIQQSLIDLHNRGFLLAITSKNNESDVFEVFENHPHSLLKKEHFSAFRVNWENKAENIADLAVELNLGLDSLVFLDDSDFECDLVKNRLPSIEVRQVPKRLYEYPDFVSALIDELFYIANETSEDAARTELYAARQKAAIAKTGFDDIETYLTSLDITVDMHEMQPNEMPRVAQLTQKTNQFNLCKTIYSEDNITKFHNNPDHTVYVMVVSDRFGKLGLTNVCIVQHINKTEAFIDTFLMSCRVFERNLEGAFLDYVINELNQVGSGLIRAVFKRTHKNTVAELFYENAGFRLEDDDRQVKSYALDVMDYEPKTFNYIRRVKGHQNNEPKRN